MRCFVLMSMAGLVALPSCVTEQMQIKTFLARPLSGKVHGMEWAYAHAYIDPTIDMPGEDDFAFVFLPYKPKAACPKPDEEHADSRSVMVAAPKVAHKTTKLRRGTARTMMFQFDEKGGPVATAAVAGKIRLTRAEGRYVKGKIMGHYNKDNWVNGTFTAVVCDRMELAE